MGMNVITLKEVSPEEPKRFTLDLLKTMDPNDAQNEKSRGQIVVEVTYKPLNEEEMGKGFDETQTIPKAPEGTPAGGGQLVVIVHEAQDVEGKHHTNPQARLIFRGEEKKTKVQDPKKYLHSIFHFSSFRINKVADSPTFSLKYRGKPENLFTIQGLIYLISFWNSFNSTNPPVGCHLYMLLRRVVMDIGSSLVNLLWSTVSPESF